VAIIPFEADGDCLPISFPPSFLDSIDDVHQEILMVLYACSIFKREAAYQEPVR